MYTHEPLRESNLISYSSNPYFLTKISNRKNVYRNGYLASGSRLSMFSRRSIAAADALRKRAVNDLRGILGRLLEWNQFKDDSLISAIACISEPILLNFLDKNIILPNETSHFPQKNLKFLVILWSTKRSRTVLWISQWIIAPNIIPGFFRLDLAQERLIRRADNLHDARELIDVCNG